MPLLLNLNKNSVNIYMYLFPFFTGTAFSSVLFFRFLSPVTKPEYIYFISVIEDLSLYNMDWDSLAQRSRVATHNESKDSLKIQWPDQFSDCNKTNQMKIG